MRIAVIADVHANLEALHAVLGRIAELRADEIICLGDIVGYNANPNECVELVRERGIASIMGNHDACASGVEEPDCFNPVARSAVLWTRDRLSEENRGFLAGLPRERRIHDVIAVHGSIHDTNRYLLHRSDAIDNFRLLSELPGQVSLGFFAHTHVGVALGEKDNIVHVCPATPSIELLPGTRYLVNPGSVGQPRDGDPRASFLIYELRERRITYHRIEYDIQRCQGKIVLAGLPSQLADRIGWGR